MLSPFPWEGCDPWRGRRHSPIQYLGVWGKNHFSGCLTPTWWCCCCSSVAEWCLTLHSPMGCRMPGHLFPFYLPWSDETRSHDLCLFVCLSLILGFKPAFSLSFFTLIKRFFSSSLLSAIRVVQFSSVQSLSHVRLFVTPWTEARQASLSFTNSQRLLNLMSIKSVMPSNHLIFCRPLLLLSSIFPSIRVFSSESVLCIRWPKYWIFSFSISPSNEYSGLISFRIDWFDLLAVQGTLRSLLQYHSSKASILWQFSL